MSNVTPFPLNAWQGLRQKDNKGNVKKNMTNLMIHLENVEGLGADIRFNELTQTVEWQGRPFEEVSDIVEIRVMLEAYDFEVRKEDLFSAIVNHSRRNSYHPVRDYLNSIKWDGVTRLDKWLSHCMGADDTPFNRLVGRKFLISAVARVFDPGCKVDTVLILEGNQGVKKSTAIQTLFGKDFTSESVNLFNAHNKMVMSITGSWCVELAEFVAVMQKDEEHVKGLLSMQVDKTVLPYAKTRSSHPRQCVFAGTHNPDGEGYLGDITGNRRFWPVRVVKADIDILHRKRDQLWAEAKRYYMEGERWWLDGEEEISLAEETVAERQFTESWTDILAGLIDYPEDMFTYPQIYQKLCLPIDRVNRESKKRVRAAMKSLGYVYEPRYINGASQRMWLLPA